MAEGLAVIGPGAIGTWLAWRLSAAAPVQLVGRDRAWLARARSGLNVKAALPARRPRPKLIAPTLSPSGDPAAIFICVKSGDTAAALAQAKRLAGKRSPVVSLQNGLTHVEPTRKALGAEQAVFGACYAAVLREGPATVRHHAGETVRLGFTAANKGAAADAREWLLKAGLDAPVPDREDRVLWTKAVFNAATNPLGALSASTNGQLAEKPALWELLIRALGEARAAAKAEGHPVLIDDMEAYLRRACLATPNQENSMLQDLRAGRKTEIDAIVGPLLAAARRRGKPAPVLSSLSRFVRSLEKELAA